MDRKELLAILERGPAMIRMNDGSEYTVSGREYLVTDIALHTLYHDDEDGKIREVYLPLVTMAAIHPVAN